MNASLDPHAHLTMTCCLCAPTYTRFSAVSAASCLSGLDLLVFTPYTNSAASPLATPRRTFLAASVGPMGNIAAACVQDTHAHTRARAHAHTHHKHDSRTLHHLCAGSSSLPAWAWGCPGTLWCCCGALSRPGGRPLCFVCSHVFLCFFMRQAGGRPPIVACVAV